MSDVNSRCKNTGYSTAMYGPQGILVLCDDHWVGAVYPLLQNFTPAGTI